MNHGGRRLCWCGVGLAAMCLILGVASCQRTAPNSSGYDAGAEPAWFEDITDAVGLKFNHDAGPTGAYFLPQIIGSGAALFDFDQDGRLDLYLIQNGGPKGPANRLYRQCDGGKFEDVSDGSGLDVAGFGMGVAVGDVNNDGLPDVVLTGFRGVRLFLNQGKGRFKEATKLAGLDSVHWATSASFVDFDRDGWLDLVVVHYLEYDPAHMCSGNAARRDYCHPNTFKGTITQLYRNRGPQPDGQVKFEDVTVKSGLARRPSPGLGVLCADFNGDHWPDILVANDAQPNHLWINQQNGTFVEEAVLRGCAYNAVGRPEGNMGIALGDVDGDGLPDLFITHLTEETSTLWKQGPRGMFSDRTAAAGLAAPRWRGTGFGVVMADFNQDGHLDLALVNGRVARSHSSKSTGFEWNDYAERNQIFANDGQGKFRDVSPSNAPFTEKPRVGRGLCGGDICGNGRVDLLATNANGPARLYRNVAPSAGHWLIVRVIVPEWKRDAHGAQITVSAGERRWTRLIQPGSSYLCSNDHRAHFGLGAVDRVDTVSVIWPDGTVEDFPGGPVDRRLVLNKGEGIARKVAETAMSTPVPTTSASNRRSLVLPLLGVCVVAALGMGAYIIWLRDPSVDPPVIELSGVADPAVQKAIRGAIEQVRNEPRSADAWGKLAMILYNQKFADDSLTCFQQAEKYDAADLRWPYHQGLILMSFDPPRAVPKLVRAVELAGDKSERPRLRLAELYLQIGQFDEGRRELETILEPNSGHPRANLAMARVLFQGDRLDESRKHLEAALGDRRTRKSALRLSAEIQQRQGDAKAAQRDLAEALTLPDDPEWPDRILDETARVDVGESLGLRLAGILVDRQQLPHATVLLHDVTRDYPQSTQAWLLLGYVQLNTRFLPQAEQSLLKALKFSPESTRAMLNLGTLKALQKDHTAAIAWFRKAIEHKPDSLQAHLSLGASLKETKDRPGAIAAFEGALRCQPLSAAAHAQLGELLLQENQAERTLIHLQQAVDLNPNDAAAQKLLDEARQKPPLNKP